MIICNNCWPGERYHSLRNGMIEPNDEPVVTQDVCLIDRLHALLLPKITRSWNCLVTHEYKPLETLELAFVLFLLHRASVKRKRVCAELYHFLESARP